MCNTAGHPLQDLLWQCQTRRRLEATIASIHTPFAEMLAVVSEEPVAVFAYPGAGAADYLMAVKALPHTRAYPYRPASGEM
jgi:hypothetical protein